MIHLEQIPLVDGELVEDLVMQQAGEHCDKTMHECSVYGT